MTIFSPGQVVYWAWAPASGQVLYLEWAQGQAGSGRVNKGTVVIGADCLGEVPAMVYCKLDGEEAYMHVSSRILRTSRAEVEREIAAALLGGRNRG